ncbi:MAG: LytR C-terminal domain-containing protein [Candidatus Curtissbacteria bacterium]
MTDYPTNKKSSKKPVWAKVERARKWRGVLAIFICIFLGFFIANGILRAFSFKNDIVASKWNDSMPYAAAVNTKIPSVVVFNKDVGEVVVLVVPGDITVGEDGTVSDAVDSGPQLSSGLTRALGLDIKNYVMLKNSVDVDVTTLEKAYGDFASISTLFRIITVGKGAGVGSTNITRIDLLRLWWQVKSSGIKTPKIIDLEQFLVVGPGNQKSLDRELFHSTVDKYFEIRGVRDQNIKLEIKNSSGVVGAGQIASEIASSMGYNVIRVETGEAETAQCHISGGPRNTAARSYLANIFGCDIVFQSQGTQTAPIMVDLGSDFAKRLF